MNVSPSLSSHPFALFPSFLVFSSPVAIQRWTMSRALLNSRRTLDPYDSYQKSNSKQVCMDACSVSFVEMVLSLDEPYDLIFNYNVTSSEAMRPQSQNRWTILLGSIKLPWNGPRSRVSLSPKLFIENILPAFNGQLNLCVYTYNRVQVISWELPEWITR